MDATMQKSGLHSYEIATLRMHANKPCSAHGAWVGTWNTPPPPATAAFASISDAPVAWRRRYGYGDMPPPPRERMPWRGLRPRLKFPQFLGFVDESPWFESFLEFKRWHFWNFSWEVPNLKVLKSENSVLIETLGIWKFFNPIESVGSWKFSIQLKVEGELKVLQSNWKVSDLIETLENHQCELVAPYTHNVNDSHILP